eukprot:Rhum_TRINITY_DN14378_c1_g1::Rhum_TRINITY_DN14378_c1_g1_i1::g.84336::m.84336
MGQKNMFSGAFKGRSTRTFIEYTHTEGRSGGHPHFLPRWSFFSLIQLKALPFKAIEDLLLLLRDVDERPVVPVVLLQCSRAGLHVHLTAVRVVVALVELRQLGHHPAQDVGLLQRELVPLVRVSDDVKETPLRAVLGPVVHRQRLVLGLRVLLARVQLRRPARHLRLPDHDLVLSVDECLRAEVDLRPRRRRRRVDDLGPDVHAVHRRKACRGGGVVRGVDPGQGAEGGVPVRRVHVVLVLRPAHRRRDEPSADEGVDADTTLPVRLLPALQRPVVRAAGVVDGTAVVAGEDEEQVVPEAACLQGVDDLRQGVVQVLQHRGVRLALIG